MANELIPVGKEQAKAVSALSEFGTTVVRESSELARYVGRVLGTIPHDTVGLVLGDPLLRSHGDCCSIGRAPRQDPEAPRSEGAAAREPVARNSAPPGSLR